jgi:hypothetical protein
MVLTPEQRRELALAEVRQHRPAGQQEVVTLEFRHPSFPVDEIPRVVNDNEDLAARLEDGSTALFVFAAFNAVGPAAGENRWPEIELSVDGIAAELEPHLERALDDDAPVQVILREYVRAFAMEGPARVISGLELDRTVVGDLTVRGTAGRYGFDRRFGRIYDPRKYPGLG